MQTDFFSLVQQYGEANVKHMGNKVIVIDRVGKWAIGYTIESYAGYNPDGLKDKTYTDIINTGGTWDGAYDMLFGKPNRKPDFQSTITI